MKAYHNIEKSKFVQGAYIGYSGCATWRICKMVSCPNNGKVVRWECTTIVGEFDIFSASTLAQVSEFLANYKGRK